MPGVRFSPEQRAKAVRLVAEATPQHESQWAAVESVASKIGASAETVRKWVRRAEVDAGERPGMTSEEHAEVKRLRREVAELRRANEILKAGGCRTNRAWWSSSVAVRRGRNLGEQRGRGWSYASRNSLSRLWVAQMSFHSLAAAASPRRDRLRILRLCLICPKIGSMVAARFL